MSDTVVIKGTKSGIILVLDKDKDYDLLKEDVAAKFKASAAFLGEAQKAISFQGRKLTQEQKVEMIDIIRKNSQLDIVCIMEDDSGVENAFKNAIDTKLTQQDYNIGQFYKGNLRSGQALDVQTSLIILGDVKAGANVIAAGNVIILGALKGNVCAGYPGNTDAFVFALDMDPVQIRIADTIARAPDKQTEKRTKETKIAFWENGNIYIEPYNKEVMSDIRL